MAETAPAGPAPPPRQHWQRFGDDTGEAFLASLPETLEYEGEFGTELVLFLPFVTWLSRAGRLGRHRLRIHRGMGCFYRELGAAALEEKATPRRFVPIPARRHLPVLNEHDFDGTRAPCPMHAWPDLRLRFRDVPLACDLGDASRPLLIVHNKYTREWRFGRAVNHITPGMLDATFAALGARWRIVYIRHGRVAPAAGYSRDHNAFLDGLEDGAVLARHPGVLDFDALFAAHVAAGGAPDVNLFKNALFARAHHFITSQGGGSFQCAAFSGARVLVLHRTGVEQRWAYRAWFGWMASPPPSLSVATRDAEFLEALALFAAPCIEDGVARLPPGSEALARALDPGRRALRAMPGPFRLIEEGRLPPDL